LHLVVTLALFVVVAGLSAAYLLLRNHDGKATDALAAPAQVAGTIGAVPPASPASGTGTGSASLPAAAGTSADQPSSPSPVTRTSASEDPSALNASAPPAPATNPPTTTQPGAGAIPSVNGTASPSAVPQTAPATAPAQELPPPPQPFVPLESAVEIVRIPAAKYPETAMKNRIEGRVVVEVAVSPEGKPVGSKILNSDNEMFDDAATEAAMNGTYKPATMNDAPVASKVSIPFNFRLKH
jgi:protein TonB